MTARRRPRSVPVMATSTPADPITPSDIGAAATALDTKADARNRGLRSILQVLIVGIVVDVIPLVIAAIDSDTVHVRELVKAGVRALLAGVLAIAMRYYAPPPAPES